MDCKDRLSRNLRVYLAERRISLSKASEVSGISRSTLTSIYYSKTKMIKFETLEQLAKLMDCEVYEMFQQW